MLEVGNNLSRNDNVFALKTNFQIKKMGGSILNAYHLNPYIKTVAEKFNIIPEIVQGDDINYLNIK